MATNLADGSLSLYDPNDPLDFGNLSLVNYQLTASSPATTLGTNLMSHSGLNTNSLNNMDWLVPENGSELTSWQFNRLRLDHRHRRDHGHSGRRPHQRNHRPTRSFPTLSRQHLRFTILRRPGRHTNPQPPFQHGFHGHRRYGLDLDNPFLREHPIPGRLHDLQYRKSPKR
jgi:hypothetical protein